MASKARKVTLRTVTAAWQAREEFDCNGTLTATYTNWPQSGRLNEAERARLDEFAKHARDIMGTLYVVWSYATPIAWVVLDANGKETSLYRVAQRFSVTTSKHQGRIG
jgi:hypothetical protein